MKKSVALSLAIALTIFLNCTSYAQTTNVYWSFTSGTSAPDNAGTIPGISTSFSSGNAASLSYLTNSPASSGYTTAAGFAASGGNGAVVTARAGAFDLGTNTYFAFSLSASVVASASYQITDVSLGSRSTASGPIQLSLYESISPSSAGMQVGSAIASANSVWAPIDFSSISVSLPDDGSTAYFRLYGTISSGLTPGAGNWRIDDLGISVVATPEPSVIALVVLGGVMCFFVVVRKRRFSPG